LSTFLVNTSWTGSYKAGTRAGRVYRSPVNTGLGKDIRPFRDRIFELVTAQCKAGRNNRITFLASDYL